MTPEMEAATHRRGIVVGIDGSEPARTALAWAAKQSSLTESPLTVISTWSYPASYGFPITWPDDIDFAADAQRELDESVKQVLGADPKIEVTTAVLEGHPALELVEASRTATLLVVGSRGHGEFAGMLLGSVSQFVAMHSHCPVVIIRGEID
jgi:nucleotide-binding universal stress UspA family protein